MRHRGLGGLLGLVAATVRYHAESDGELLTRFAGAGDESAFAGLLHRHGSMVLGVCRRVLGNHHDAEDAFQATFLVLARKAAYVRPPERVGHWLHGVAMRTALEARRAELRRRGKEATAAQRATTGPQTQDEGLREVIDVELRRLAPAYAEVIVLCDLEGRGRREVADLLGCPEGTVASRLARARDALAKRLARQGLGTPAPLLAALPPATVPAPVVASTIHMGMTFSARAPGVVPGHVAALAHRVIQDMWTHRVTKAALVILLAVLAGTAVLASGDKGKPSVNSTDGLRHQKVAEKEEVKEDKELAKLNGTWVEESSRRVWIIANGKLSELTRVSWNVAGGKLMEFYRGAQNEGVASGTIQISAGDRPRAIDISYKTPGMGTVHGIYELSGGTLRACLADRRGPRPAELKTGGRAVLYTFRRVSLAGGKNPIIASELRAAYEDNAARGDEQYADREVAVIGSVKQVRRRPSGYMLHIRAGTGAVLVEFGSGDRAELAKLTTGQIVTVRGKCQGTPGDRGSVVLSNGKLVGAKD